MKCLHQEFNRVARRMRTTANEAEKDELLERMMSIWKKVDDLIVDRPTKVPPIEWQELSVERFL